MDRAQPPSEVDTNEIALEELSVELRAAFPTLNSEFSLHAGSPNANELKSIDQDFARLFVGDDGSVL
jgi:hypothetical protein